MFRREILEAIGHGVVFTDPAEKITYANRYFFEITGYDESEVLGRTCRFLQGPETAAETKWRIRQALDARTQFDGDVLNYRKNGDAFWNSMSITPQFGDDGELIGYVGITRDVTESKARQLRNEELEQQFRLIFQKIQAGIVVHSPEGDVEMINLQACRLLGLSHDEDAALGEFEELTLMLEDGTTLAKEDYPARQVAATGEFKRGLIVALAQDGLKDVRWLSCSAFPICNDAGEVTVIVSSVTDITHAREQQFAAQRDRERFELASRAAKSMIFDWNLVTGALWTNQNFERIFGTQPPAEMNLDNVAQFVLEAERETTHGQLLEAFEQGSERLEGEFRFARPRGGVGIAHAEFMIHYNDEKPVRIVGAIRDLTELRRKEQRLETSEERLRIVAELSSDMLWELDPRTDLLWRASEGVERLGLDPSLAPYSGGVWHNTILPEDRREVIASFCEAIEGKADRWRAEYRIERADGSHLLVEDRAAIIRSKDGTAIRVVGAVRDITESRRLEDILRENQSLEALGQLTGGVAHDFNNMLMIIMGNAETLAEDLASPTDRERLELIHSAARNGAELTSRLLSFARQQPLAPQRIDIAEQMAQAARLIRHALPDQVELTVDVEGQTLYAEVDPSQLDNALVNLALNARDAMPQGGSLSLEARPYRVEAGLLDSVLEPGDYIRIAMVDTGAGIAPEIAPRVFEPFFTTKPIGDGTGLGLSMVYGFAKQSGGYALVESSPGKGTTVSIFLPQAAGGRPVPRSNDASPRMGRQNATILLVEDDTQVRDYVEWILNAEGYSVLSASDGREALEILEQHTEIRLMCTDVVMPGRMDGIELTREAQRRLPGLKVLVISGYASEASLREALDWSDTAWLPKPFTRRDLAGALAQMERS